MLFAGERNFDANAQAAVALPRGCDDRVTQPKDGADAKPTLAVAFRACVDGRLPPGDWVLIRVFCDRWPPAGRILVFDRNERECFIDGPKQ